MNAPVASAPKPQIGLVLSAVFLSYLGQMILNPIIAPLAREVGLAEWQIGVTFSTAAMMVVLTGQLWGGRGQSWGRKRVLILALTLATTGMALFAAAAWLGMTGVLVGTPLFLAFLVTRGLLFGTSIAAIPTTAQSYIASVTHDEKARIKGMAGVGAVQGTAMIAGAVVGGLLAAFGLGVPIIFVPVIIGASLVLTAVRLRPDSTTELIKQPARISPFDGRVWPFLVAGFGMFTALGFIQIITGFLVQDRLHLSGEMTGLISGAALLCVGLGLILAQGVIVPRSGWGPTRLLRTGSTIAIVSFALFIPDAGLPLILVAMAVSGLGIGIAVPGYTAGPTLSMKLEEQGNLAGLITATNGLTFVISPTLSTALYGIWPLLPIIVGGVLMTVVAIFLFVHPKFRELSSIKGSAPLPSQAA